MSLGLLAIGDTSKTQALQIPGFSASALGLRISPGNVNPLRCPPNTLSHPRTKSPLSAFLPAYSSYLAYEKSRPHMGGFNIVLET